MPARPRALPIAALCACALAAYSNSFRTGLPVDNQTIILKDARIHAATQENLHLILTKTYWYPAEDTELYRPLTTLSYLFNYAILGNGPQPAGYHWVNFLLHVVNVSLVYLLALAIFGEALSAFALAAVWALHPLLTESVTNVVGRADLLAGFAVLAGLLCHIRAAAGGRRKPVWLAALALVAAIGAFSKENGVMVLPMMAAWDLTLGAASARWRDRLAGYLAAAAPFAIFWYVRGVVLASLPAAYVPFTDNPLVGAGFWSARLTAIKVIGNYLWLLVWPRQLSCDYSYNQVPLSGWGDWPALLSLAVCLACAAAAIVCYRRNKRVCFFITWFFVTLAPTANLVVLIGTIMAERFLYLPAVGFAGCAVVAVYTATRRLPKAVAPAILAAVAAAFAARAYVRNLDWMDDESIWTSAVHASPASFKTHLTVAGFRIGAKGETPALAIPDLDQALAVVDSLPDDKNVVGIYVNAGQFYRRMGDSLLARNPDGTPAVSPQSLEWYRKSLNLLLRGERIMLVQDQSRRRQDVERGWPPAQRLSWGLYEQLGLAYLRVSDYHKAVTAFESANKLHFAPAFFERIATAYRAAGELDKAAVSLMEALVVDPNTAGLPAELADIYRQFDPGGCALQNGGLNLACPLVHSHVCTAARNVVRLYLEADRPDAAAQTRLSATGDLGCAAGLFQ